MFLTTIHVCRDIEYNPANEGKPFPFRMLTLDRCYPACGDDNEGMFCGKEVVALCHVGDDRKWEPKHDEWRRFGWKIKDRSTIDWSCP